MLWRLFTFLIFQAAGATIGWMQPGPLRPTLGALLGVVGGGVIWLLIDMSRGVRLLRWLRLGATSEVAMRTGMWGELSDRVRRLVRNREQLTLESQSRLQDFLAAFQASPNGVVMLDSHGQIEWFNQIAASHFGLDSERDKLQHFGNLVRDPGFASYFSSQNYSTELVMPGRESTPSRPVKLSVQLHPYGEGRLLLLSRDVTAVEQAEAMRRDFVANVSHEIRTPLTVLSGFVETLQTLPLDEEERVRYLALMALQAERMQTLVSDLLTLSRLEGSPPPGGSEWIQVGSLAADLEQEGRSLSAALHGSPDCVHHLLFETSFLGALAGSRNELRSAMSNLVGNAIRYTAAGGKIKVRTTLLPDGKGEFSVTDSGPGIAEEHIPRLTERFYRVDRSRSRDTGGTGLGLAIVKHVAQRHGAELKIESQLGVGSTFNIIFPASRMRQPSA
ncbi:phosphate regulon sensor histidine kinase PhoR [Rhodoferax sp. PAMC 29310]|uniref:phosphate regulon sensor histidine kinase PhoR n=1 Tax=Rhodoferax sp. PAMC 29310 TaxID=2822760 RepID=UPI001B31FBE7|nr:phosphate regulon sensor histidine kinase PhoR [Rhodoferax sp. PAMC 29310]